MKNFLTSLIGFCASLTGPAQTNIRPTPTADPDRLNRDDLIIGEAGTIPKGATLYRYRFNHGTQTGIVRVLARNEATAAYKARNRVADKLSSPTFRPSVSLKLISSRNG